MARPHPFVLTEYIQRLIQIKARQIARRYGFNCNDEDDVRQELTAGLLGRAHHYDPARASLHTFADRVVASVAASLLRQRRRRKRAPERPSGSFCDADRFSPADAVRRLGAVPSDDAEQQRQHADIAAILRGLPPELQALCQCLIRGTPAQAARELGWTRYQVGQALERLRAHFRAAGWE